MILLSSPQAAGNLPKEIKKSQKTTKA